jgi:hypothetical protein
MKSLNADKKTRTFITIRSLGPKPSASTNFAISALFFYYTRVNCNILEMNRKDQKNSKIKKILLLFI